MIELVDQEEQVRNVTRDIFEARLETFQRAIKLYMIYDEQDSLYQVLIDNLYVALFHAGIK